MGKNVADFYDKDIENKLNALEVEEDKILNMEAERAADHVSSDDEGGITVADLKASCLKVKGKINILKQRSKLKEKRRANSKIRKLDEFTEKLKEKGFDVTEE